MHSFASVYYVVCILCPCRPPQATRTETTLDDLPCASTLKMLLRHIDSEHFPVFLRPCRGPLAARSRPLVGSGMDRRIFTPKNNSISGGDAARKGGHAIRMFARFGLIFRCRKESISEIPPNHAAAFLSKIIYPKCQLPTLRNKTDIPSQTSGSMTRNFDFLIENLHFCQNSNGETLVFVIYF